MHVVPTSTSDDDDAAMRQWAPCSPLDDIADSNGALSLSYDIFDEAGGRGRGEGGCGQVICPRPRVLMGTLVFL